MILLRNSEISEYPIGEYTHLLQNREISDIRIGFMVLSRCCKIVKYLKISARIWVRALIHDSLNVTVLVDLFLELYERRANPSADDCPI